MKDISATGTSYSNSQNIYDCILINMNKQSFKETSKNNTVKNSNKMFEIKKRNNSCKNYRKYT